MNGAHEQNNLRFNDTSMSYRIGEFNKDSFVSGNSQTSGNFPGFKLNNQYRVYIGYFNAANVQLNQAGGQVEMSLHASPMIQASPPLVRPHKVCYVPVIYFGILNALCMSTEYQIMCYYGYIDISLQHARRFAI
jgi:hypothetical protein